MKRGIKFFLNRDSKQKGCKSIYCVVCYKRGRLILSSREKIEIKNWESTKQRATGKGCGDINKKLDAMENKISRMIDKMESDDNVKPSWDILKTQLINEYRGEATKKNNDFIEVFEEFIEVRKLKVSKATTVKFNTILSHIKDYANKEKVTITFDSIDKFFFDSIINYYISINISDNTQRKNIQFIKSFLRWAVERDYTSNIKFEKFRNIKENETDAPALTLKEYEQIVNCKGLNDRLQRVRDLFLFQLYSGQRFSDVAKFDYSDITMNFANDNGNPVEYYTWNIKQRKTRKNVEILLPDEAITILRKYNNQLPKLSNQKLNNYLKELGQLAGIDDMVKINRYIGNQTITEKFPKWQLLCTHTARRSFVTLGAHGGLTSKQIKTQTGHESDKMKDVYDRPDNYDTYKAISNVFKIKSA